VSAASGAALPDRELGVEASVMRYSKSLFCELLLKPELLDKIRTILSGDQSSLPRASY